jgi:hypothetical protein
MGETDVQFEANGGSGEDENTESENEWVTVGNKERIKWR